MKPVCNKGNDPAQWLGRLLVLCLVTPSIVSAGLPGWVKKGMRETDQTVYFTGVATHAVLEKAEQAAIDHATTQALAFIGERSSASRQVERNEEGFRARRTFESRSAQVLLREKRVTKRHVRRADDGRYEVFVQIGYPRHVVYRAKAARETARRKARAELETTLGHARMAWQRGDARAALNYLALARERASALDDAILATRVEGMAGEWTGDIRVMVISGGGQRIRVGMLPSRPVRVKVSAHRDGEVALAGVPLRLRWNDAPWQAAGVSGTDGILDLTARVQADEAGPLRGEVAVDWLALGLEPAVAAAGSARLALEAVSEPRAQRVALRIEERQNGEPVDHSFLEEAVKRALVAAGFRVMGEPVSFNPLDKMVNVIMNRADIVVEGWLESSHRSDNDGWVVSAQASGMLRALDSRTVTTLVQIQQKSPVTFGETLAAAAREARETVATAMAREMLHRLVIRVDGGGENGADRSAGER